MKSDYKDSNLLCSESEKCCMKMEGPKEGWHWLFHLVIPKAYSEYMPPALIKAQIPNDTVLWYHQNPEAWCFISTNDGLQTLRMLLWIPALF